MLDVYPVKTGTGLLDVLPLACEVPTGTHGPDYISQTDICGL